jgi:hypothetical protein
MRTKDLKSLQELLNKIIEIESKMAELNRKFDNEIEQNISVLYPIIEKRKQEIEAEKKQKAYQLQEDIYKKHILTIIKDISTNDMSEKLCLKHLYNLDEESEIKSFLWKFIELARIVLKKINTRIVSESDPQIIDKYQIKKLIIDVLDEENNL